jgi:hypothetical protein
VAQDLEGLEGPTQSPDLLNCFALPGTVFSRLGSAPWWDTGGTGPLYWFSFFEPLKLGDGAGTTGTTIDGTGWHWPTAPSTSRVPTPRHSQATFRILTPATGSSYEATDAITVTWEPNRKALRYRLRITSNTSHLEVYSADTIRTVQTHTIPADTFTAGITYTVKVWAITGQTAAGNATSQEPTSNTVQFSIYSWVSVASGFNQRWQSADIYTATAGTYKLTHANAFQRASGSDSANVSPTGAQSVAGGSPTLPLLPAGAPGTLTLPAVTYGVALYRLNAGAWTAANASVIFTATAGQVIKVKNNVNDADNMSEYGNHSFALYKAT